MILLPYVLPAVVAVLALALLLATWRLVRGPSLPDRVLALDTLYIDALALLVALGIWLDTPDYFEAALLIGLLGFIGTVVVARFLLRGRVIE